MGSPQIVSGIVDSRRECEGSSRLSEGNLCDKMHIPVCLAETLLVLFCVEHEELSLGKDD